MSFNWPDIPFSGTEVDAFVVEYKALAQTIYDDWDNDADLIYDLENSPVSRHGAVIPKLKAPFRKKESLKTFLEYGLLYSSFIVKQRASNSGPGTDFELGNSPFTPPLSTRERIKLFEDLGCVFTKEAMECAYQKNNPGKNPPPGLDGDDIFSDGNGGSTSSPPGGDADPDDIDQNFPDEEQDCPNKTIRESLLITLANIPPFSSCYRDKKAALLEKYLTCDGTPFTESDMGGKLGSLESGVQSFYDEAPNVSSEGTLKENITSELTQEQKDRIPAGPTDTVWLFNFYNTWGENRCLHTFFGSALVVINSSGKVIRIKDDFDFVYGNTLSNRDVSNYGNSYDPEDVQPGFYFGPHQKDRDQNPVPVGDPEAFGSTIYPGITEVSQVHGTKNSLHPTEIGRGIVANAYLNGNGRGTPVPINISFE